MSYKHHFKQSQEDESVTCRHLLQAAKDVPRICFLSGLTGEELMMFVRAFPDAKLEPTVFAAMVPNNAQKTIEELMEEIMGDHERLSKERN
ncbi:hypothetical protein L7F22_064449 [Adiantum nelumboides]|nr:hypothetical protein [Adiantum nelumboides]